MKNGQNLRELQQRQSAKEEEMWVKPQPCHVCKKVISGAYGQSWIGGQLVWSCSGACEKEVQRMKGAYNATATRSADGEAQG